MSNLVAGQVINGGTNTDTVSVTLPAPPTPGNLLIAGHHNRSGVLNIPSGWTLLATEGVASVLYRIVESGDSATLTITTSVASESTLSLIEVEGCSDEVLTVVDVFDTVDTGVTAMTLTVGPTGAATSEGFGYVFIGLRGGVGVTPYSEWSGGFTTPIVYVESPGAGSTKSSQNIGLKENVSVSEILESTITWGNSRIAAAIIVSFKNIVEDEEPPPPDDPSLSVSDNYLNAARTLSGLTGGSIADNQNVILGDTGSIADRVIAEGKRVHPLFDLN